MLIEETADTQARVGLSQETIDEYAEKIAAILKKNPLDVFFDGTSYYIGDGWHRFLAAVKAGLSVIPCVLHDGTERDAMLFAAGANQGHGLKRSNRDKRRAVEIMLADEEWATWSNNRIAEHCGVGDDLVSDVRRQYEEAASRQVSENDTCGSPHVSENDTCPTPKPEKKRVGRDGKAYPVTAKPAPKPDAGEAAGGPDVEALSLPYRESVNLIDGLRRKFEALAKSPEGIHLQPKIQRLANELNTAKGTIRQAEPLALCGKCEGEGCQHCARTGWWPRSTVESLKK
jgi:hypothetical protein